VKAVFQLSHFDRPPMGDIWDSIYLILLGNPEIRVVYRHQTLREPLNWILMN
jgi:hypothetical protein